MLNCWNKKPGTLQDYSVADIGNCWIPRASLCNKFAKVEEGLLNYPYS